MKKVNLTETIAKLELILDSTGKATVRTQIAEALLRLVDDLTRKKDKLLVMARIIIGFDPENQQYGGYRFGPPWTDTRHTGVVTRVNWAEFFKNVEKSLRESRGDSIKMAKSILEMVASHKEDERVVVFAQVLFSGACPFNFFQSKLEVTEEEFSSVRKQPEVGGRVKTIFDNNVRFLSYTDQAMYFKELLDGRSEKEQLAILGCLIQALEFKAKRQKEQGDPSRILAETLMGAVGGCDCPECRTQRATGAHHLC